MASRTRGLRPPHGSARQVGMGLLVVALGCSQTTTERLGLPEPSTVEKVDLERYAGTWYEIARFPNSFQEGCANTTATYTLRDDGRVGVLNRCLRDGEVDTATGYAEVVDPKTRSKLEVTFFWPFSGDYWIVDLADDYSYAAVADPGRDYLWILSRTPTLPKATYERIVEGLREQGFEVGRLERTPQKAGS